jgi:DNA-3-methyladenine glycosylase
MTKLDLAFYQRSNTLELAEELLGKVLVTRIEGRLTSGMIVETEAYLGKSDKASHAYAGRRTGRTEVMYMPGGVAYVYLCYGIHHLFNVVTNTVDEPHAVLVRAVEPLAGLDAMLERRGMQAVQPSLCAGPGVLAKALGIHASHTGTRLWEGLIYIEDHGITFQPGEIIRSPRVGVGYAKEDALLPYRFRVAGHPWTSPAK